MSQPSNPNQLFNKRVTDIDRKLAVNPAAITTKSGKTTKTTQPEPPKTQAQLLFQGQNHPKKRKKIVRMEQWIEVRIRDGRTVTKLYPPNDELIKCGQRMLPPPEFVYRRINFPDGIPPEYNWAGPRNDIHRERGGCGIQRMTVDTWLNVIEREKLREDGHIGPTGVGNLPRPQEHGPCSCPVCTIEFSAFCGWRGRSCRLRLTINKHSCIRSFASRRLLRRATL
jgi:hypothetical protein